MRVLKTLPGEVLRGDLGTVKLMVNLELFSYLLRVSAAGKEGDKPMPKAESHKNGDDLSRVFDYIFENVQNNITLQDLANVCCLEKTYFLKKFKQFRHKNFRYNTFVALKNYFLHINCYGLNCDLPKFVFLKL